MTLPSIKAQASSTISDKGILHILISDLNTQYFNDENYKKLAKWVQSKGFKKIIIYSTGTLQIDSMMLNEELAGTKVDKEKNLNRGRRLERQTVSKVLREFDIFKKENQFEVVRVKPKNEQIHTPPSKGPAKESKFGSQSKVNKKVINPEVKKELESILRFQESKKLPHSIILRPKFTFTHFFTNPLGKTITDPACAGNSFILYLPWSAIVDGGLEAKEYSDYKSKFNNVLKVGEYSKLFEGLVNNAALSRLVHFYEKNQAQIKMSKIEWIKVKYSIAKKRTSDYFKKEIPFFLLLQTRIAHQIYQDTGEPTYLSYPMEGPFGEEVFKFTRTISDYLTTNHPTCFSYINTSGLFQKKTASNIEHEVTMIPVHAVQDTFISPGKKYLLDITKGNSPSFTRFLYHASEFIIDDLLQCSDVLDFFSDIDEEAIFLQWLDKNNLLITPIFKLFLTKKSNEFENFLHGTVCSNISLLITPAGINYLNRTCLAVPLPRRQGALNEILQQPFETLHAGVMGDALEPHERKEQVSRGSLDQKRSADAHDKSDKSKDSSYDLISSSDRIRCSSTYKETFTTTGMCPAEISQPIRSPKTEKQRTDASQHMQSATVELGEEKVVNRLKAMVNTAKFDRVGFNSLWEKLNLSYKKNIIEELINVGKLRRSNTTNQLSQKSMVIDFLRKKNEEINRISSLSYVPKIKSSFIKANL